MRTLFFCLLFVSASFAQLPDPQIIWDRSGVQDSSGYGHRIIPLGDQNHDGFADWAVYASGNYRQVEFYNGTQFGYIEFFHGGNPPHTIPYLIVQETANHLFSGDPIKVLGDINHDNVLDFYLRWERSDNPGYNDVTLYRGGEDTLALLRFTLLYDDNVKAVGDFNGDQFADYCVHHTTDFYDYSEIYFGSAIPDTNYDWIWYGPPGGVGHDASPVGIGDLDGDGYSDILGVSSWPSRYVVLLGSSSPDTIIDYEWTEASYFAGVIKDLTNDGRDELLVEFDSDPFIIFGQDLIPRSDARFSLNFSCDYGPGVANLGDINDDDFNDFALLTSYCTNQWYGLLSVYLGGANGVNPEPALTIEGSGSPYQFNGIAGAEGLGDVDGDGVDDWAVASFDDLTHEGWRGRMIILGGTSLPVSNHPTPIADNLSVSIYPNPFNAETNFSLQVDPHAGPVEIQVFDLTGRQIFSQTVSPTSSILTQHFSGRSSDGTSLSTGLYFLRIQQRDHFQTAKLIVLR